MTDEETTRLNATILATQVLLTELLSQFEDDAQEAVVKRAKARLATVRPLAPAGDHDGDWLALIRDLAGEAIEAMAHPTA